MINQKPDANRSVFEKQLLELNNNAMRFEEISYLKAMKLLPPDEISKTDEWSSPLEFIVNGRSPEPHQDEILNALQQYLAGRLAGQEASMQSAMANYKAALLMVPGELFDITVLQVFGGLRSAPRRAPCSPREILESEPKPLQNRSGGAPCNPQPKKLTSRTCGNVKIRLYL